MPRLVAVAALLSGLAAPAFAQEADAGLRQLGAHVHGGAELIMAADPDGRVVAELSGAHWNFYGFEGAAGPDRADAVSAVNARLAEPGLVSISETAGCALVETTLVGAPTIAESGRPGHGGHDHGDAHPDPDEDHDHADQDEGHAHQDQGHEGDAHGDHDAGDHHGEEGSHDHAGPDAHGNLVVNWSFQCDRPARMDTLDLAGLFAAFERLDHVEAQYLDTARAAAGRLTPASPSLRLN